MSRDRPPLYVAILAAGKGKRMGAPVSKVMLPLCGKPILQRVIDAAAKLKPAKIIIVVGANEKEIRGHVSGPRLAFARQPRLDGNAGAMKAAMKLVPDRARVVGLFGDGVLTTEQIGALADAVADDAVSIRLLRTEDASSYSRFIRDRHGKIIDLITPKCLTPAQRMITECDAGGQGFPAAWGRRELTRIKPHMKGGELFMTDLIPAAVRDGMRVETVDVSEEEGVNINTPASLLQAEAHLSAQLVAELRARGVLIAQPASVLIRGEVQAAAGSFIGPNVLLAGKVTLKAGAIISANCMVEDCVLDPGARLEPFTHAAGAVLGRDAIAGPYARLREGTVLKEGAQIGNYVETKAAVIGKGSKAKHLAYIGDAVIGDGVNIGAGAVFCNYDGVRKHKTKVGKGAFIGAGCMLVAPLSIGAGAQVAAGAVVVRDVPARTLVRGLPAHRAAPARKIKKKR